MSWRSFSVHLVVCAERLSTISFHISLFSGTSLFWGNGSLFSPLYFFVFVFCMGRNFLLLYLYFVREESEDGSLFLLCTPPHLTSHWHLTLASNWEVAPTVNGLLARFKISNDAAFSSKQKETTTNTNTFTTTNTVIWDAFMVGFVLLFYRLKYTVQIPLPSQIHIKIQSLQAWLDLIDSSLYYRAKK